MKFFLLLLLLTLFMSVGCREELIVNNNKEYGTIYVDSSPLNAAIFITGKNTAKVTPDSLKNIYPGLYSITLRLSGFRDTTLAVKVEAGRRVLVNIVMKGY
ncbi:MAG: PEGA domain-containing protein [Ignavibacteriales bacterium]|nr:PEGA domain-containing protein [Ignavibacteriales bacterium]MCF8305044.1 PEGA domain-containing protein [Ignavibacteriales bacterium]MCF8314733.1 PEGA domain-containing protein [Ignavibacteriales bacterium]MCF8438019.1 PEGA domain-containing protein [Ignavibacteriales bacterium]